MGGGGKLCGESSNVPSEPRLRKGSGGPYGPQKGFRPSAPLTFWAEFARFRGDSRWSDGWPRGSGVKKLEVGAAGPVVWRLSVSD